MVQIIEKGRVGPGQMIAINFKEKKFYSDVEIKKYLSEINPFGKWTKNITHIDKIIHSGIYFLFCIVWYVPIRELFKKGTLLYVFLFSIFYGILSLPSQMVMKTNGILSLPSQMVMKTNGILSLP